MKTIKTKNIKVRGSTTEQWHDLNAISGKSAYEIAVDHGYEGTEEEYVNAMKGKSAYELAVDHGYEGTEEEYATSITNLQKQIDDLKTNTPTSPSGGSSKKIFFTTQVLDQSGDLTIMITPEMTQYFNSKNLDNLRQSDLPAFIDAIPDLVVKGSHGLHKYFYYTGYDDGRTEYTWACITRQSGSMTTFTLATTNFEDFYFGEGWMNESY